MKLKYRIAAILAAAVTALSLTSCGSPQQSSQQTTAAQTTEPSTAPAAVVDKYKTYDYEVREIWCENDGQKIYGQAFVPKTDGRSPLIITSHGLGANHESGASYAKKYAPKGFAVYTFDFRGGSNKNVILAAAKTWDFVDTDRIFLQGGSQGGLVTAISGMRHQDEVAGLILLYPAFGMVDFAKYLYSEDMQEETDISGITVGKKFFEDIKDYDVREEISDFTKPVLILQGSEDNIVLPSVTKEASELYPDSEYHIIDGAGHGFSGEYHDEATEYALDFLYRHI